MDKLSTQILKKTLFLGDTDDYIPYYLNLKLMPIFHDIKLLSFSTNSYSMGDLDDTPLHQTIYTVPSAGVFNSVNKAWEINGYYTSLPAEYLTGITSSHVFAQQDPYYPTNFLTFTNEAEIAGNSQGTIEVDCSEWDYNEGEYSARAMVYVLKTLNTGVNGTTNFVYRKFPYSVDSINYIQASHDKSFYSEAVHAYNNFGTIVFSNTKTGWSLDYDSVEGVWVDIRRKTSTVPDDLVTVLLPDENTLEVYDFYYPFEHAKAVSISTTLNMVAASWFNEQPVVYCDDGKVYSVDVDTEVFTEIYSGTYSNFVDFLSHPDQDKLYLIRENNQVVFNDDYSYIETTNLMAYNKNLAIYHTYSIGSSTSGYYTELTNYFIPAGTYNYSYESIGNPYKDWATGKYLFTNTTTGESFWTTSTNHTSSYVREEGSFTLTEGIYTIQAYASTYNSSGGVRNLFMSSGDSFNVDHLIFDFDGNVWLREKRFDKDLTLEFTNTEPSFCNFSYLVGDDKLFDLNGNEILLEYTKGIEELLYPNTKHLAVYRHPQTFLTNVNIEDITNTRMHHGNMYHAMPNPVYNKSEVPVYIIDTGQHFDSGTYTFSIDGWFYNSPKDRILELYNETTETIETTAYINYVDGSSSSNYKTTFSSFTVPEGTYTLRIVPPYLTPGSSAFIYLKNFIIYNRHPNLWVGNDGEDYDGSTNHYTIPATGELDFVDGLHLSFNDNYGFNQFVANDYFYFVVAEGVVRDNYSTMTVTSVLEPYYMQEKTITFTVSDTVHNIPEKFHAEFAKMNTYIVDGTLNGVAASFITSGTPEVGTVLISTSGSMTFNIGDVGKTFSFTYNVGYRTEVE